MPLEINFLIVYVWKIMIKLIEKKDKQKKDFFRLWIKDEFTIKGDLLEANVTKKQIQNKKIRTNVLSSGGWQRTCFVQW